MAKARKYMVIEDFKNDTPKKTMFKMETEPLPELKKDQFLVKAEYISVDPYMRSFAHCCQVPYLQFGFQVGKVMQSNNKQYPVESRVVSHAGWRDYTVLDGQPDQLFAMKPYQPDLGPLPLPTSLAVGALGMPGITAYLGFLEICKPQKGETVCVTSACGAVGSLVGQIARIAGCTVIGLTGTDQKVETLKELRFTHALNYKSVADIKRSLKMLAPKGIDCFFDNVGGSLYNDIMQCMSEGGRVSKCAEISTYDQPDPAPPPACHAARARCHIEPFSFTQWPWSQQQDAIKQMRDWIESGEIIAREAITDGFDYLPDAFIGMLKGDNIGKAVVKV